METKTINCRYCRKLSPANDKQCLGCGAPVANAIDRSGGVKKEVFRCPKCDWSRYYKRKDGSFCCTSCYADFESDDFTFVDDRPDVNLEKIERHNKQRRR